MGCCMADYAANQVDRIQQQHQQAFRQNAPDPYITATGQICVPFIPITGEWSPKYPHWIQDWGVTQQEWRQIIQTLDKVTKPIMESMYDTQKSAVKDSMTANPFNMGQTQAKMINRMAQGQAQMMKIPQLVESTLYSLNQNIFGKRGLQAVSGGAGIIIYKRDNPPVNMGTFNPMQGMMAGQSMMGAGIGYGGYQGTGYGGYQSGYHAPSVYVQQQTQGEQAPPQYTHQ